jgi:hypothetical protein
MIAKIMPIDQFLGQLKKADVEKLLTLFSH